MGDDKKAPWTLGTTISVFGPFGAGIILIAAGIVLGESLGTYETVGWQIWGGFIATLAPWHGILTGVVFILWGLWKLVQFCLTD